MIFFIRLLSVLACLLGSAGVATAQSEKSQEKLHEELTTYVNMIPGVLPFGLNFVDIYAGAECSGVMAAKTAVGGDRIYFELPFDKLTPARVEQSSSGIIVNIDGICPTKFSPKQKPTPEHCAEFHFDNDDKARAEKLASLLEGLTKACTE